MGQRGKQRLIAGVVFVTLVSGLILSLGFGAQSKKYVVTVTEKETETSHQKEYTQVRNETILKEEAVNNTNDSDSAMITTNSDTTTIPQERLQEGTDRADDHELNSTAGRNVVGGGGKEESDHAPSVSLTPGQHDNNKVDSKRTSPSPSSSSSSSSSSSASANSESPTVAPSVELHENSTAAENSDDCPPIDYCKEYKAILRIQHSDANAAAGTLFFIYVVNHLIYADQERLLPWIHLENHNPCFDANEHKGNRTTEVVFEKGLASIGYIYEPRYSDMGCIARKRIKPYPSVVNASDIVEAPFNTTVLGNGIWSTYFQQLEWQCCQSVLPLVELTLEDVMLGLHYCAPWAVRPWPFDRLPKGLQPKQNSSLDEWYAPLHEKGSRMVQKYIHPLPWIMKLVDQANPLPVTCMAMHIRMTDKGHGRVKRPLELFQSYADVYASVSMNATIYVATDDLNVLQRIVNNWTLHHNNVNVLHQSNVIRSATNEPVFDLLRNNPHRINTEALVEIYAMSRCQILVHGFSAMTEAVLYNSPTMLSINVDDENRNMTIQAFEQYMKQINKK